MHDERGPVTMKKLFGNMARHVVVNFGEILYNENLIFLGSCEDTPIYN